MKWNRQHRPFWERRFAWLPTAVGARRVWWEYYYESTGYTPGVGLNIYRGLLEDLGDDEIRRCDDRCPAAAPHINQVQFNAFGQRIEKSAS